MGDGSAVRVELKMGMRQGREVNIVFLLQAFGLQGEQNNKIHLILHI